MKTTIQQLSRDFAAKAGFDLQVNTFGNLIFLLDELVPVIQFSAIDKWTEDVCTISINDVLRRFSDCYTPDIQIIAKKEIIAMLMNIVKSNNYCFLDVDNDLELYDDFEDVPDETTTSWDLLEYEKMNVVFEQLRAFTESEQIDLSVKLYNITPENNCEDAIHFNFSKGKMSGGGVIKLVDDNSVWFPVRLCWLCLAFKDMTIDEISALGIEIDYQRFEGELLPPYDCGILIGLNYKYGKTPHVFDDLEPTVLMVKKYPILIKYLPDELRSNKQIVLAFIEANDTYVSAYDEAMDNSVTNKIVRSSLGIRADMEDAFRNGLPDTLPIEILEPFWKDVEVLTAVSYSSMWEFYLTPETYDEKVAQEVAANAPRFACVLFNYWKKEIKKQPKIANSISVKYQLRSDAPMYIVALYKCIDLLKTAQRDCSLALGFLMAKISIAFRYEMIDECFGDIAKIFRDVDVFAQNRLAEQYLPLLKYMRADDIEEELAELVAKNCPIAASLLPNSYVLKYNLEKSDEEDDEDVCKKCSKCFLGNIRWDLFKMNCNFFK